MSAPPGYNPNASLLPVAGGEIPRMSGGYYSSSELPPGFNATKSLLPSAGGVIREFSGGDPTSVGFANGTKEHNGPTGPAATTSTAPAATTSTRSTGSTAPVVANASTASTGLTASTASTGSTASTAPNKNNKSKAETAENPSITKKIILFGESLTLQNPLDNKPFSADEDKALTMFGIEAVYDMEKREVITALYDGTCNTDKPLIMLEQCEPIRRIVQTLALSFLGKLNSKSVDISDFDFYNTSLPITYQIDENGFVKISIDFGVIYPLFLLQNKKLSAVKSVDYEKITDSGIDSIKISLYFDESNV